MNTEATPGEPAEAFPKAPPAASTEGAPLSPSLQGALSLPLLHRDSPAPIWQNKAPHLWPGLPNMPATGYTCPSDYPFSPAEAAVCLGDLDAMSVAALSGVPLQALAASENRAQAKRDLEESDALRRFAANGEEAGPPPLSDEEHVLLRKAAQKTLLWAWLLEERQREVRDLARNFDAGAGQLMDALGVEEDADLAGLHATTMQLGDDAGIMPPWKLVLENAALFLPASCTVIVNDARMAEAVADTVPGGWQGVDATTCAQWGLPSLPNLTWVTGVFPLWPLLGRSAPSECRPWLSKTLRVLLPHAAPTITASGGAA